MTSFNPEFECIITIRGWSFSGKGCSKKTSKAVAATKALEHLHNIKCITSPEEKVQIGLSPDVTKGDISKCIDGR